MKKVLINVEERELRIAIMEDDHLVELYIESLDEKSILNNIYKGRVEDVLPGLKAAFVNVGLDRNAFLHFDDVRPDLLWGKYRELNPDMADDVPSAKEALSSTTDAESEDDGDSADRRKRRRGRRGGKKRRPDSEDSYTPGLPVGVTEDDLEDDEDDDTDSIPVAAKTDRQDSYKPQQSVPTEQRQEQLQQAQQQPDPQAQEQPQVQQQDQQQAQQSSDSSAETAPQEQSNGLSEEEIEARKQARMEKQRQRRERWEQKKLERQQRRQQEREERQAQRQTVEAELPPEEPVAPPVYGTRAAASAYDSYTPYSPGNQRRQNKARYGDSFGNVAVTNKRRNDHRDSQEDFFGPVSSDKEDVHSVWDDRQPNLGPVPGMGKAFLSDMDGNNNRRGSNNRRTQGSGQQNQNRNSNSSNSNSNNNNNSNSSNRKYGNNNNNKRRGGKKRTMRKRDNRSYFAFSADDIENDKPVIESVETAVTPEKPKRTRKTAAETKDAKDAEKAKEPKTAKAAVKKPAAKTSTAKKPAAKRTAGTKATATKTTTAKTAPAKTTRKKKADTPGAEETAQVVAMELPLGLAVESEAQAAESGDTKKTTRTRKTPVTSRVKKSAAKAGSLEESKPMTEKVVTDTTPVSDSPTLSEIKKAESVAEAGVATEDAPASIENAPVTSAVAGPKSEDSAAKEDSSEGRNDGRRRRNNRPSRAERAARHRERKAEAAKQQAENPKSDTATADQVDQSTKSASGDSAKRETAPAEKPVEKPRQQATAPQKRDNRRKLRRPYFQEVFKKGDEIMVQVVKEEIGLKGARISSYVSLPGRYLVLLPYPNQEGGISRKVEDIRERKRLKTLLRDISTDETAFIVRTAGIYQEEKEIRNDVEFLSQEWGTIAEQYKETEPTSLVYDDHDILYRLARDVFDDSVAEIQIDSHTEHEKLKEILEKLIPGLVDKVKLYSGAENIFQKFGVTKQIQKAARRKVWLKSGGYLIIDEAEALTAIDVNTGKSVGKDDQEKLILRTNIESARAVARELKLRDIGGLIVIDFIDMKDARNKEQVLNELKLQLRKDRSKTSVSSISEFGLVEMTRKRVRRSLRKTLFMDCPYCQGAGVVLNEQQIWLHIKHEMVRQLESTKPASSLSITVNPRIRAYIDQSYRDVIRRLEQKYDTEIRIIMSDIFHIENYQIEKLESTSAVIAGSATVPTR